MSTFREQFSAVRKAQVETQLDFVRSLTNKMVESTGQVVALNLSTGRSSIARSADALRQLLTVQSPSDLVNLSTQQAGFDTLLNYSNQLFNIASGAQAELLKSAAPAALVPGLKALPSAKAEAEVKAEVEAKAEVEVVADVRAPVELAESVEAEPQPEPEPIQAPVQAPVETPVDTPEETPAAPAAPQLAAAPEAAPAIQVAELVPVPVPGHGIEETVLAKAIGDTIEHAEAPVLAASPLVAPEAAELKITGIAPVDATAPLAQNKPGENGASKSRRKK